MFLDWYVRFRGIDEWPETTGVIQESELIPGGNGPDGKNPDSRRSRFTYEDESGERHHGEVEASEETVLFPLEPGDTFKLRYNPKIPDKTFALVAHEDSPFKELFVTICVAVALILLIDHFARR
jgi:hypothetical protein